MLEIARGDVEILVHTTAPSRGPDDARYRALAQAYLDFQPVLRRRLDTEPQSSIGNALDGEADCQLQEELLHSTQDERESRASYCPDDEDEIASKFSSQNPFSNECCTSDFLDSPQLSFQGVADNFDSPAIRASTPRYEHGPRTPGERKQIQSPARSWKTPPSTIADSQPNYEQKLVAFSTPTIASGLYLQNRTRSDHSSPTQSLYLERVEETILDVQSDGEAPCSGTYRDHVAQLSPSSQNKSQSKPLETRGDEIEIVCMEDMISTMEGAASCPSGRYSSSPPPVPRDAALPRLRTLPTGSPPILSRKRAPRSSQDSPERVGNPRKRQCIEPSSSQVAAFTKIIKPNMSVASSMVSSGSCCWAGVLEIRPNPPRTSTAVLTGEMLITDPLRQLVNKVRSSQCLYPFIPQEQTRELRPMERGYWQVSCDKWDTGIRDRCWSFLGKYVGGDSAGWGVSCIRDAETRGLRVYCWGIVVEHIYLLLHMASASKIKGTGACWIGGDGSPIITMPS